MRSTSDPEAFVEALPKNKDGDALVLVAGLRDSQDRNKGSC